MSKVVLPENKSGRSFQLRRAESLDWKKIASLDIDKIIQEGDEETLKDLLPQITYCQPDIEFDHNRTDPGFRKVFRLGQLIIEHLIQSQETTLERATFAENKYTVALQENKGHQDEIQRLRERLVDARKELKRRKEMIESNQTEIMGGPQNKDEYDQCPYCSKKFINSMYLYSHLQRRHQGLPNPAFPSGTGIPVFPFHGQRQGSPTTWEKVNTCTQTEEEEEGTWKSGIDQTVNHLVEKYLTERLGSQESFRRSPEILPASSSIPQLPLQHSASTPEVNENEQQKTFGRMKEELETQWRGLVEKIHKTELEDLKRTLVAEMQKMQEILSRSGSMTPRSVTPRPVVPPPDKSPPASIAGRVEERFQKQENELEHLKLNLQTRIRADMEVIESRLESQERFWRAKLRTVESEYQKHIGNLREEFQQTLLLQRPQPLEEVEVTQRSPTRVNWPPNSAIATVKPPTAGSSAETVEDSEEASTPPPAVLELEPAPVPPVPKPRLDRSLKVVTTAPEEKETEVKVTGRPPKVPKENRSGRKAKAIPARAATVMLQPKDAGASSSSDLSISDDESESIGTYSARPPVQEPKRRPAAPKGEEKGQRMQSAQAQTETVDMNLNVTTTGRGAKAEALQELGKQLKELGVSPTAIQLPKKKMKKSLKTIKNRRKRLSEDLTAEREIQKEATRKATNTKILEAKANNLTSPARRLSTKPLPAPSRSPLVKMFAAVKSGGSSLRRKMSSMATSKKSKAKTTVASPRNRPKPPGTVTTPRAAAAGPSRKSAPPPPPPVPAVIAKKTAPKLQHIFRRSLEKAAEEEESSSETDDGSGLDFLEESLPLPIASSPVLKGHWIPTTNQASPPQRQGSRFRDEGPDEESQVITARRLHVQRKAEKELKLSRYKSFQAPIPETADKKRVARKLSSDSGSDDDDDGKRKGVHSSSARNEADATFDPSISSMSPQTYATDG